MRYTAKTETTHAAWLCIDDDDMRGVVAAPAKAACQLAGASHHSTDRVAIFHGSTVPTVLCGFHASWGLLRDALRTYRSRIVRCAPCTVGQHSDALAVLVYKTGISGDPGIIVAVTKDGRTDVRDVRDHLGRTVPGYAITVYDN